MKYQGRNGQTLCVIAGYRPNPPQGPYTVYAQQNAFFHMIKRDICPRKAFLVDLVEQLKEFMEAGDHIVLMLDGNCNMKHSDLSLALGEIGMTEAILRVEIIRKFFLPSGAQRPAPTVCAFFFPITSVELPSEKKIPRPWAPIGHPFFGRAHWCPAPSSRPSASIPVFFLSRKLSFDF